MRQRTHSGCANSGRRPGFTLAEIVVVIAIIAILMAMSAGAYFQVMGSQKKTSTEAIMTTLASELDKQWKAARDNAMQETIPATVLTLAGGDPDRARVIWVKYRLKQEFPVSYTEILSAGPLPAKDSYVKALQAPGVNLNVPLDWQASACLLLALRESRRGMVFHPDDQIPPNALTTKFNDGIRQIVDAWGEPIFLYRWPTAEWNVLLDLNPGGTLQPGKNDRQDPNALLCSPAWLSSNGGANSQTFKNNCHDVNFSGTTPLTYNIVPVIVSKGRNGIFNDGDDIYSHKLRKAENRGD